MLLDGLSRAVCVSAGRAWPFPHAHTCSHTRISADPEGYRCWGMRGGGGQAAETLGARTGAHAGARAFWGQADLSSVKKKFDALPVWQRHQISSVELGRRCAPRLREHQSHLGPPLLEGSRQSQTWILWLLRFIQSQLIHRELSHGSRSRHRHHDGTGCLLDPVPPRRCRRQSGRPRR